MEILQLNKLTAGYGRTVIIRDINLQLEKGEIYCILGRNGVGKSTLLKTIMGLLPVMSGVISMEKQSIVDFKSFQIANLGVAYAEQDSPLFAKLSVEQNLVLAFRGRKASFKAACEEAFQIFPILKERLNQKAGTLSGGEKKMLLMARVMIFNPKLILLDEITEGVQPSVIEKIGEALRVMKEEKGITILLVEQNVDFAFKIADSYAVMNQGMIKDNGVIDEKLRSIIEQSLTI